MLDPFAAVPVVPDWTRCEPGLTGGMRLVRAAPPRGRFAAFVARRFGWSRERVFELDAIGARFFAEIDGQRSLAEIEEKLRRDLGLDRDAARTAVTDFVRTLMRRGLIALRVESNGEETHG
jgi:hypothetical protein